MQLKGLVRFFTILLIIYSLYQLSFTWVVQNHEKELEKLAQQYVAKNFPTAAEKYPTQKDSQDVYQEDLNQIYQSRLARLKDSTKEETVHYGFTGPISYQKAKAEELNLGLDLQGGMNVIMQVEISGDDVYVLNSAAKKFMLVMTDSLGDEAELINPIDTLSRKYKYAGDYGSGKKNIISIRDDSHPERVQFFIHLEDKNSDCSGELRGEGIITSGNTFEYRKAGDPCVLLFSFTKNSLKLSEVKGCGSRMGALKCSFNGNYPKKKETKMPVSATESK